MKSKVRCLNCLGHGAIDIKGTKCSRCLGSGIEPNKGKAGLYDEQIQEFYKKEHKRWARYGELRKDDNENGKSN